ncbi:hypothetical protein [Paraburkholderia sp. JHI869]|uniref:hypothetical protein n=1 Tax=Paraburkholderia sp. JHI869 TaxID=3112959 RepID=UPI0031720B4E
MEDTTIDSLKELVAREGLEEARKKLTWYHAEMTRRGVDRPHDYVSFYKSALDGHIWPTLDALAREVKVPAARVRKALFLAQFPESIIDLFFHERLTPKLARALSSLADVAAEDALIFRAESVPEDASLSEKLTSLVEAVQDTLDQRAAEASRKEDCSTKSRNKRQE